MAMTALDDRLYLFGGVGAAGTESILDVANDLWTFTPDTGVWAQLPQAAGQPWPEPRRCCGFTASHGQIWCWGGSGITRDGDRTTHTFLNDLWSRSAQSARWEQLEASDDFRTSPLADGLRPEPRYTPAFHRVGTSLVLFGGYTEDRAGHRKMNDVWIYSDHTRRWRRPPPDAPDGYQAGARWPGVRYGSMNAADDQMLYVCGGFADDGDHIDVWSWDLAAERWTMLSADGDGGAPRARYCAAMVCHQRALWMFGGRSRRHAKDNFSDTWRFDLDRRQWEQIEGAAAEHRYDGGAPRIAYHAKAASAMLGERWFVWGGEGLHGHVSDMWYFDFTAAKWSQVAAARDDDPRFW